MWSTIQHQNLVPAPQNQQLFDPEEVNVSRANIMSVQIDGLDRQPPPQFQLVDSLDRYVTGDESSTELLPAHQDQFSSEANINSGDQKKIQFRSTKGASKQRRDLINLEIYNLRDFLPLPDTVKARLSYLHIMSLACVYVRKGNFFSPVNLGGMVEQRDMFGDSLDFTMSLKGFIVAVQSDGKLLYISENVTEYLGHSMVDLLTQNGSFYDIIDKRDHGAIRTCMMQNPYHLQDSKASLFCRMTTSRSMRRQECTNDNKVVYISGYFQLPVANSAWCNQPVFVALCTPFENKAESFLGDSLLYYCSMKFTSVHEMDMKFIKTNPSIYNGFSNEEMTGRSWYDFVHPEDLLLARHYHQHLIHQEQGTACSFVLRLQDRNGEWVCLYIKASVKPLVNGFGIECENNFISEQDFKVYKEYLKLTTRGTATAGNLPIREKQPFPVSPMIHPASLQKTTAGVNSLNAFSSANTIHHSGNYAGNYPLPKGTTMELVRRRLKRRMEGNCFELSGSKFQRMSSSGSSPSCALYSDMPVDIKPNRRRSLSDPCVPAALLNSSCMYDSGLPQLSDHYSSSSSDIGDYMPLTAYCGSVSQENFHLPPTPDTPSGHNQFEVNYSFMPNVNSASTGDLLTPDASPLAGQCFKYGQAASMAHEVKDYSRSDGACCSGLGCTVQSPAATNLSGEAKSLNGMVSGTYQIIAKRYEHHLAQSSFDEANHFKLSDITSKFRQMSDKVGRNSSTTRNPPPPPAQQPVLAPSAKPAQPPICEINTNLAAAPHWQGEVHPADVITANNSEPPSVVITSWESKTDLRAVGRHEPSGCYQYPSVSPTSNSYDFNSLPVCQTATSPKSDMSGTDRSDASFLDEVESIDFILSQCEESPDAAAADQFFSDTDNSLY